MLLIEQFKKELFQVVSLAAAEAIDAPKPRVIGQCEYLTDNVGKIDIKYS